MGYDIVPLTSVVYPIFDFGVNDEEASKFFYALPKKNWTDYFSNKIVVREDQGDDKSESDKEEIEDWEEEDNSKQESMDEDSEDT